VKGATMLTRVEIETVTGFNPRAREGRDQGLRLQGSSSNCFNPRAREGRDVADVAEDVRDEVSIHAPVKGATGM